MNKEKNSSIITASLFAFVGLLLSIGAVGELIGDLLKKAKTFSLAKLFHAEEAKQSSLVSTKE